MLVVSLLVARMGLFIERNAWTRGQMKNIQHQSRSPQSLLKLQTCAFFDHQTLKMFLPGDENERRPSNPRPCR